MSDSLPALPPESVALFDDLGLLVHDCDEQDPSDQVIFTLLQMKTLLATAFELDGFKRGIAINPKAQNLAVEFSSGDRLYKGFKTE